MSDVIPTPRIVNTAREMRAAIRQAQAEGDTVGLVPTMGALHAGHVSLVAASNGRCDRTAVTIFVNPTQFLPGEDFEKYPRTLDADLASLADHRVDWVFVPSTEEMYGPRDSQGNYRAETSIDVGRIAHELEGRFRPGHFPGVATVVMKLFQIAPADAAFFGQKDYQQTCVVRAMCDDLNLPIEIVVGPTIREPDGLALSSRNRYLSAEQREQALALHRCLRWAEKEIDAGQRDTAKLIHGMRRHFDDLRDARIEYIAIADPETLQTSATIQERAVLLLAVRIGETRLIDNFLIEAIT